MNAGNIEPRLVGTSQTQHPIPNAEHRMRFPPSSERLLTMNPTLTPALSDPMGEEERVTVFDENRGHLALDFCPRFF